MNDSSKVCDSHGPVVEYAESNDWLNLFARKHISVRIESFRGDSPLVETEASDASDAERSGTRVCHEDHEYMTPP